MANSCYNNVVFSGKLSQMLKVRLLFEDMKKAFDEELIMRMPEFVNAEKGHMYDIELGDEAIYFSTKWLPNFNVIQQISDHFGLDFVQQYDDIHTYLFGEATYRNGEFSNVFLDTDDYARYNFNCATGMFEYDGQEFDDDMPVLKLLLEAKKERITVRERFFQSTGQITREELTAQYGDLPEGELLLKFAEHKNFDAAKKIFEEWDERTIIEMENYLIAAYQHANQLEISDDAYIAMRFLDSLIGQYDYRQNAQEQQPAKAQRRSRGR